MLCRLRAKLKGGGLKRNMDYCSSNPTRYNYFKFKSFSMLGLDFGFIRIENQKNL